MEKKVIVPIKLISETFCHEKCPGHVYTRSSARSEYGSSCSFFPTKAGLPRLLHTSGYSLVRLKACRESEVCNE